MNCNNCYDQCKKFLYHLETNNYISVGNEAGEFKLIFGQPGPAA